MILSNTLYCTLNVFYLTRGTSERKKDRREEGRLNRPGIYIPLFILMFFHTFFQGFLVVEKQLRVPQIHTMLNKVFYEK